MLMVKVVVELLLCRNRDFSVVDTQRLERFDMHFTLVHLKSKRILRISRKVGVDTHSISSKTTWTTVS